MTSHHTSGNTRGDASLKVFGRRAVIEALESEEVFVDHVTICARETPSDFRSTVKDLCDRKQAMFTKVERKELTQISGDPRNDQGVCAHIRLKHIQSLDQFEDSLKGKGARLAAPVLALDNVTNPQNVGMIVRTAVAAGMRAILWPIHGSPWISGLVVKASAATVYRCPIVTAPTLADGIDHLRAIGFTTYALAAGEGAQNMYETPPEHRSVFIVGSEAQGISPEILDRADHRLMIPMAPGVESLNVAVAASLVCYHAGNAARS